MSKPINDDSICHGCAHWGPDVLTYQTGQTPQEYECAMLVPGAGIKSQCGHYIYVPGALA